MKEFGFGHMKKSLIQNFIFLCSDYYEMESTKADAKDLGAFCGNSYPLKANNYFCKKPPYRCLPGS